MQGGIHWHAWGPMAGHWHESAAALRPAGPLRGGSLSHPGTHWSSKGGVHRRTGSPPGPAGGVPMAQPGTCWSSQGGGFCCCTAGLPGLMGGGTQVRLGAWQGSQQGSTGAPAGASPPPHLGPARALRGFHLNNPWPAETHRWDPPQRLGILQGSHSRLTLGACKGSQGVPPQQPVVCWDTAPGAPPGLTVRVHSSDQWPARACRGIHQSALGLGRVVYRCAWVPPGLAWGSPSQ